jgi:hypothetical protein
MAQPAVKQKTETFRQGGTLAESRPLRRAGPVHKVAAVHNTRPVQKTRTFHALVQVTRLEEWSVEAGSAEEARDLLQNGDGHRSHGGECVHFEIDKLLD